MDLFSQETSTKTHAPLASRMRPNDFDSFVGQEHLVGKGKLLRAAIENDQLFSMILWGPPGSGKNNTRPYYC